MNNTNVIEWAEAIFSDPKDYYIIGIRNQDKCKKSRTNKKQKAKNAYRHFLIFSHKLDRFVSTY